MSRVENATWQFNNTVTCGDKLSTTSGSVVTVDGGKPTRITKFDLGGHVQAASQSDGSISSGVAGETNYWSFRCGNQLAAVAIGTQTLLGPAIATTGINISGDQTNNDGWELRGASSLQMGSLDKDHFKVKTSKAFYMKVKFSIADVSGFDDIRVGFSQKDEAFTATTDNYTDAAWFRIDAGDVKSETIIANASTVTTDLAVTDWADGETHTMEVLVSDTGVVTYKYNGSEPSGAVAYQFAEDLLVTPMIFLRHDSDVGGALILEELEFGLGSSAYA